MERVLALGCVPLREGETVVIDNSDILRLASEANAARNAYDSAICKSLTGIIYGRRLIQAVDALTAAIAEQAAQQPVVHHQRSR